MPAVLIAPGGSAGAWQGHGSSAFGRSWGDEGDVKKQKGFGAMASCGGSHRHRVVSSHRGAQAAWSPQGVSGCVSAVWVLRYTRSVLPKARTGTAPLCPTPFSMTSNPVALRSRNIPASPMSRLPHRGHSVTRVLLSAWQGQSLRRSRSRSPPAHGGKGPREARAQQCSSCLAHASWERSVKAAVKPCLHLAPSTQ